jgi:N-acyl-D-aspartate/D-glutamate deacylase
MDDSVPTCPQVLRMATEHGAMTTPFGAQIGRLEPGRSADAVMINWRRVTWPYQDDDVPMLDALIQRAKTGAVDAVIVDGEVIYKDGRFTRIDRDAILSEIAEALSKPRTPAELASRELRRAVSPHVREFYRDYLKDEPAREPFYAPSSRS